MVATMVRILYFSRFSCESLLAHETVCLCVRVRFLQPISLFLSGSAKQTSRVSFLLRDPDWKV